jgi:hypothetical protein
MAHRRFKRDLSPEAVDRETAEEKDDPRPKKGELLIEPRLAERDLCRCGATIAAATRGPSGKAFRDRGAIRKMVLIDPGLCEPPSQLRARAAAERLPRGQLDRARRLADDRDAIVDGSGDDRPRTLEVPRRDASRAGSDACVKIYELEIVGVATARS